MRAKTVFLAATAAIASACAHYTPAPIEVASVATGRRAAALDEPAIRAELIRLAPDYQWGGEWNGLTLFAAALAQSPAIAAARAGVAAAAAEARAARVAPGPTLTLTAEYAFNPAEASPWLVGAASDILLDIGGRRKGRIEAADVAARVAAFDYAASVWSVRMAIRRALDAEAGARETAALAGALVKLRDRQFEAVRRRVTAGEESRLELDRVREGVAGAAQTEAMANADLAAARLDIAAAVGVSPDALDATRIESFQTLAETPGITEAQTSAALTARTEILKAAAAYDQAEAALRVAVASQYPDVSIGPGYMWERGLSKLPLALSLSFPSSDLGRAAIRAAQARRAEAGRRLESEVAGVLAGIARAAADYRAAWTSLQLIRMKTIPTAEAFARQADRELAAGAVNRADWAASQAGLLTAQLDEIAARRRVLEAQAALEDALRQPLSGPETAIAPSFIEPVDPEFP
ncbi:MAG: TolC family protein [Parvularculaceae bacterium]